MIKEVTQVNIIAIDKTVHGETAQKVALSAGVGAISGGVTGGLAGAIAGAGAAVVIGQKVIEDAHKNN